MVKMVITKLGIAGCMRHRSSKIPVRPGTAHSQHCKCIPINYSQNIIIWQLSFDELSHLDTANFGHILISPPTHTHRQAVSRPSSLSQTKRLASGKQLSMESRVSAKGKSSKTHMVTYLLLITVIFVIAVVVGYRSYQHLYYRQGLRHNGHGSHDGYDDEESVRQQQHQQSPDEYSSLLRSDLDLMQRDAGNSLVSERDDRGSAVPVGTSNSTTSAILPPGNLNSTTKMTTMATPTPKIRIHQLDPNVAYTKRLITIGDVHGCIATRAFFFF